MLRAGRLLADPISGVALAVWAAVAAFYLLPGVPAAVRERLGMTYSTLPIWPWAMAGALIDLRDVRPRERRVWQWLAVSFATLLSIEAVRAIADATGRIDRASEWFYMAFYATQWLAALALADRTRHRPLAMAAVLMAVAGGAVLHATALLWPVTYASGVPSSLVYLAFDATAAWAWWRVGRGRSPRLASATLMLALATLAFFVTDGLAMASLTGWHRFIPGHATDIIWTVPPLLYALAVRLGRAPATAT